MRSILFRSFDSHAPKVFKLFGFPIFWIWAHLMKVILETCRDHQYTINIYYKYVIWCLSCYTCDLFIVVNKNYIRNTNCCLLFASICIYPRSIYLFLFIAFFFLALFAFGLLVAFSVLFYCGGEIFLVYCFICPHSVLCAPCCQCLCILHSWLPIRFIQTFIFPCLTLH